ncbi:MAG: hypothetical protein IAG13_10980 [Deltaproteobacteria bacterium]|nr:hypothetical protein [Nannocystaceae bacterium]
MVVEIQLAKDHDKRFSWPLYMAGLRARLRCPVAVVVITLDRRVERWARRPIALDRLGSRMTPVVIGPDAVPHVVDPRRATADPELALLSLLAHADAPDGRAIGYAVLRACDALDEARARLYTDLVFAYLGDAARRELEATMDIEKYEFQSDFMKRLAARAKAEGHALGHAEGHAEGQAEGEVRGRGQAVLDVLDARAIAVPDAARAVILGCVDPERLRAWLIAAVTATAIDELGVEL